MRRSNRIIAWIGVCLCTTAALAEPITGPPAPTAQPVTESKGLGGAPLAARTGSPVVGRAPASDQSWVGRTTVSLAGVLGVAMAIGVVVRLVSKRQSGLRAGLGAGGRSPAGIMEVLGRYPVGRGATLVLLKLDRRVLLLSQTSLGKLGLGSSFTTLCEVTDPDEVASILVKTRDADGDSMSERFRSMLSRADDKMDASPAPSEHRRVRTSAGGDRAEMWDTSRTDIPIVDLTKRADDATVSGGAAGTLRRRLAAIRWPSQEGGDRP